MSNFSKEDNVLFEDIMVGFQDALVMSNAVAVFNPNKIGDVQMERSNDLFHRPMPYVAQSFAGTDMTANFKTYTQLSVPLRVGFEFSAPWVMEGNELRDMMQEKSISKAAAQKLSSDINVAVSNVAALEGTVVVKRTTAAAGFDDVAVCDSVFNEQGVQNYDRYLALNSRDYNNMAGNLAARQTVAGKVQTAYERASVGNVCSFDLLKADYAPRLLAASGVTVTVSGANQYYTPVSTITTPNSGSNNVDNRYQNLNITVASGTVRVGDCFTIAGVNAVHHITKGDTGQLKTFRVTAIISGAGGTGTIQISPPIISAGGNTDAENQYKNVTATPAAGAAITWLNTVTSTMNPFWFRDAIEIIPGSHGLKNTIGGLDVMRARTEQGFEVILMKSADINTKKVKYRADIRFGVGCLQPQMAGLVLFNQT